MRVCTECVYNVCIQCVQCVCVCVCVLACIFACVCTACCVFSDYNLKQLFPLQKITFTACSHISWCVSYSQAIICKTANVQVRCISTTMSCSFLVVIIRYSYCSNVTALTYVNPCQPPGSRSTTTTCYVDLRREVVLLVVLDVEVHLLFIDKTSVMSRTLRSSGYYCNLRQGVVPKFVEVHVGAQIIIHHVQPKRRLTWGLTPDYPPSGQVVRKIKMALVLDFYEEISIVFTCYKQY